MRIIVLSLAGCAYLLIAGALAAPALGQRSPDAKPVAPPPRPSSASEAPTKAPSKAPSIDDDVESTDHQDPDAQDSTSRADEAVGPNAAGQVDDANDPSDPQQPEEANEGEDGKKAKGGKKARKREVDIGGRVFLRNTVARPGWRNQLAIDSARFGVEYREPSADMEIEVDVEIAGRRAEIRDGYIRFDPKRWLRIQAGRFKRPAGAISLESRWQLPVLERGVASDLELVNHPTTAAPDRIPLDGRAEGIAIRLRGRKLPLDPRLTVAVMRGEANVQLAEASLPENRAPVTWSEGFPEDIYGRIEIAVAKRLHVGAYFAWFSYLGTAGTRATFEHGVAGGFDVVGRWGPFRLWLEGYGGRSPFHFGIGLRAEGQFVAARAIGAARMDWPGQPDMYIEPHIMGQAIEASTQVDDARTWQLSAGANIGFGKSWRVQLAADHTDVGSALAGYVGQGTRFIAQLGAVF